MPMRCLNAEEANLFLARLDLKIGAWSQVCDIAERPFDPSEWINYPAPEGALALYCFAHEVLNWLTPGSRRLLQIDGSTCLNEDEDFLISRLMLGPQGQELLNDSRSFLFETGGVDAKQEQWLLGDVIHLLLLFGHHCQIVSEGGRGGQHLSLQDGYVYFLSKAPVDLARARKMMEELKAAPLQSPRDINSRENGRQTP
jgi:hypothetical protein